MTDTNGTSNTPSTPSVPDIGTVKLLTTKSKTVTITLTPFEKLAILTVMHKQLEYYETLIHKTRVQAEVEEELKALYFKIIEQTN